MVVCAGSVGEVMLETVTEAGRSLSCTDLESFEARNGISLPEDYKAFLLKHNGGVPEQNCYPVADHREGEMDICLFYGIDQEHESFELQSQFEFYRENLEDPAFKNLFPIGYDSFNDQICLDLSPERYGAVIFLDLVPIWKDFTEKDIYVIADCFDDFLALLTEEPDDV